VSLVASNRQNWLFKYRELCIQVGNHGRSGSNGLLTLNAAPLAKRVGARGRKVRLSIKQSLTAASIGY
jgi:hypothetical protein